MKMEAADIGNRWQLSFPNLPGSRPSTRLALVCCFDQIPEAVDGIIQELENLELRSPRFTH
jgi:hypothetical protein